MSTSDVHAFLDTDKAIFTPEALRALRQPIGAIVTDAYDLVRDELADATTIEFGVHVWADTKSQYTPK